MSYQLGIDLGTTYTAAAIFRDGRVQVVELGTRGATIPSVIFLKEDETILTGEAAERRALTEGHRVAREFKRRLGDPTPILLGGTPYSAESLMAKLLRWVVDHVAEREGGPADAITVSHPANWGPYKKDLLDQAIRIADLDNATTMTEPEAAVTFYASQERVDTGAVIAVYDLGGGTFDAAVLRKTADGFEILGEPEGIERLGGIDFDEAVYAHVVGALDGALDDLDPDDANAVASVARLRQECVEAKEALSSDTDVSIPVMLPNLQTEVRLTRAEFEAMVRPSLADSISAMRRAVRSAGVELDEIHRVLLVGGSSRIPLVAQMVGAELGRPVAVDAHPKHSIPQGAALLAAGAAVVAGDAEEQPVEVAAPVPPPVPPPTEEATAAMAVTGDDAPPEKPEDLPAPMPSGDSDGRRRALLIGGVGVVVAIIVIVIAVVALSSGDDGDGSGDEAQDTATAEATEAPATTAPTGEATTEATPAPTQETTTTTLFPPETRTVELTGITLAGGAYEVTYETTNYDPFISDDPNTHHIHFFWNIYDPQTVGVNAPPEQQGLWEIWDKDAQGQNVFNLFGPSGVPAGATAICAVVATFDHAVDQPDLAPLTASCVDLPT